MAYRDEGEGSPVVLLHGTPSSSREWAHQIAALSQTHRVLAPDHLGFGGSDRPPDWRTYSLPWHVENLRAWHQQLGLNRYHLVVHDFGGPIGLPIALADPRRLLSLTIVQSWLWDLEAPSIDNPLMRWLYLRMGFSTKVMVRMAWGDRSTYTKAVRREFAEQFPDAKSRAGTWGFARSAANEGGWLDEQSQHLAALRKVPTLVVWGLADKLLPPTHLARWKATLPDAQILALEGIGHFPQLEAPQVISDSLTAHLSD